MLSGQALGLPHQLVLLYPTRIDIKALYREGELPRKLPLRVEECVNGFF